MRRVLPMALLVFGCCAVVSAQQVGSPAPLKYGLRVANLPQATNATHEMWEIYDGASASDCSTGGGTYQVVCWSNGTAWAVASGGGSATFFQTATPSAFAAPTVTPAVAGSTDWGYVIVSTQGNTATAISAEADITNGAATLSGTDHNTVSWLGVTGATLYTVYRMVAAGTPSTTGVIGTTTSLTFSDTGQAGDGGSPGSAEPGYVNVATGIHLGDLYSSLGSPITTDIGNTNNYTLQVISATQNKFGIFSGVADAWDGTTGPIANVSYLSEANAVTNPSDVPEASADILLLTHPTGTTVKAIGHETTALNFGSGTTTNLFGVNVVAEAFAGTVGNLDSARIASAETVSAGTATNAATLYAEGVDAESGTTITNGYTAYFEAPEGAGTIINPWNSYFAGGLVESVGPVKADSTISSATAGAASTPALSMTGTPFTGGSGTTTVPLFYLNGGTAPTSWSTSGTYMGINSVSGFSGNFLDFRVNGGSSSLFKVSSGGSGTFSGAVTTGGMTSGSYATSTVCANGASPAVCGSAASGHVAVPAGTNSTLVIDTSRVTANSVILLTIDEAATISATTCNTTLATLVEPVVMAITPSTSFTIQISGTTSTNPVCVDYLFMN